MNKRKIYKNRLEEHVTAFDVTPSPKYVGLFCYPSAYLDGDAQKELRKDVADRVNGDECHFVVEGTNRKATYYLNEDAEFVLRSYYTDVCKIDEHGNLTKLWYGYSVTTMNHINKFLAEMGEKPLSKHDWIMMEEGECIRVECIGCARQSYCMAQMTLEKDTVCMDYEEV